jgi:hypothetical protein
VSKLSQQTEVLIKTFAFELPPNKQKQHQTSSKNTMCLRHHQQQSNSKSINSTNEECSEILNVAWMKLLQKLFGFLLPILLLRKSK